MGRPRTETIDVDTRERILRAAEEAFGRDGASDARLEDIAAAAGIRRSSLLYHFGSKEQLYVQVVIAAFARLGEVLGIALQTSGTFEERFDALIDGALAYLHQHTWLSPLIVRELLARQGPGRALLLQAGVPLLDEVEAFIRREAGALLPEGFPVRAALMDLVSTWLLREAAGDLRAPLWGEGEHVKTIARRLFLGR